MTDEHRTALIAEIEKLREPISYGESEQYVHGQTMYNYAIRDAITIIRKHASQAEGDCEPGEMPEDEPLEPQKLEIPLSQLIEWYNSPNAVTHQRWSYFDALVRHVLWLEAAHPHPQQRDEASAELLRDMRCQVEFTHVATMPIPLYERMKAVIATMPAEKAAGEEQVSTKGDAATRKDADGLSPLLTPPPVHDSDCATHNEPAMPKGQCDCSLAAPSAPQVDIEAGARAIYQGWKPWNNCTNEHKSHWRQLAEACAEAWGLTPSTGKGDV